MKKLSVFLILILFLYSCSSEKITEQESYLYETDDEPEYQTENNDNLYEELSSEMKDFFSDFLKLYLERSEEIFKNYISEEFYNDYLEMKANPSLENYYNSAYYLNNAIDDTLLMWRYYNPDTSPAIPPGTMTILIRLKTEWDLLQENDIGTKYLVNISYNDDGDYLINWFTIEQ